MAIMKNWTQTLKIKCEIFQRQKNVWRVVDVWAKWMIVPHRMTKVKYSEMFSIFFIPRNCQVDFNFLPPCGGNFVSPASKSKIEYGRGELWIVSPSSLIATGVISEEGHESPAESRPFQVLFSESLLKTCSVQKAKGSQNKENVLGETRDKPLGWFKCSKECRCRICRIVLGGEMYECIKSMLFCWKGYRLVSFWMPVQQHL